MFYIVEMQDYVRVDPELFALDVKSALAKQLELTYENFIDKDLGAVIAVLDILNVGEGIIVPGDGAAYYDATFKLLVYKPELQEVVFAKVDEITNFGAFLDFGAMKGMLHISQAMEDYVNFSKTGSLIGKNSKRSLKKGDLCLARIIAISFKTGEPKIGLTMRQPGLGKLEWIEDDKRRAKLKLARAGVGKGEGKKKRKNQKQGKNKAEKNKNK